MGASTRRVVITGMGLVTPLGVGIEENWSALLAGRSGIGPITRFDASAFDVRIAGEVKGFEITRWVTRKEARKMDPFIHYAIAAARMAADDAGWTLPVGSPTRTGVIIGAGLGGLTTLEEAMDTLRERGVGRISPFVIPRLIVNLAPGHVSMIFGAQGPNLCSVSACASGAHSIGDAARLIAWGEADCMVAGGTEATITRIGIGGFAAMKALSRRNHDPEHASRPFDAERDGFVAAEGAGVVTLERLDHARARGARIYAEIVGYGRSSDAYHITLPDPDGLGAALAMKNALADAELAPEAVRYINAHGTSTEVNDIVETRAIKRIFGNSADNLWVSSTKSSTGHLLGAAGAVEAIYTALTVHRGEVPPTANHEHPDPECDLDYVPRVARRAQVDVAMTNSFGFGGTNACLILRRAPDETTRPKDQRTTGRIA